MRRLVYLAVVSLLQSAVPPAQFKARVDLIDLAVTVVDGKGRTVPNLTIEDFIVEEDGQPQRIEYLLPSAHRPISLGIVLDVSGSMQAKIRTAQGAVDRFLSMLYEEDEIFLMTFAKGAVVKADFTSDRKTLRNALWAGVNLGDGTALYDTVFQALKHTTRGRYQKKALLLVTDGEDNGSLTPSDKTLQYIRESEMLVYSLGIRGAPVFDMRASRSSTQASIALDMEVLKRFAEASGGQAWEISEASFGKNLDAKLATIADELLSQYSIVYSPNHPGEGRWHNVSVSMKNPDYLARARRDYLHQAVLPGSTSVVKYAGRPLGDVLQELKNTGLNIVSSNALVKPNMKVRDEPKAVLPRDVLDEILDQFGLEVRPGPNGILSVARKK
jgi:Ca-activated chloride channel family protein